MSLTGTRYTSGCTLLGIEVHAGKELECPKAHQRPSLHPTRMGPPAIDAFQSQLKQTYYKNETRANEPFVVTLV